jgi:hypothetical protein
MLSDNGIEPEEERSRFKISWTVEWKDDSGQIAKMNEQEDYSQALSSFNELSSLGRDVVLYELRTLLADPSAQPKRIPILNSAKAKKRKTLEDKDSERTERRTPISKKTAGLKELRTRIFILLAVIAAFIIILFLISTLFTGSDFVHNFAMYALISNIINFVPWQSNL